MSVASVTELKMYQGQTLTLLLTITDGAAVVNLAGATVKFTAKLDPASAIEDIVKTSATVGEVTILDQTPGGATEGQANIFILPADTSALGVGEYTYDIWAELASGSKHPVVEASSLFIRRRITTL